MGIFFSRFTNILVFTSNRGLDLLVYRLLFTFLPVSLSLFSKFYLSDSEFVDLQIYLVYIVSYSGLISLGFYSTFQYVSARKMLSFRLFNYLVGYFIFLSILYIIVLFFFRDILIFPNWIFGFIILLYFYNESILFSHFGQRNYLVYYLLIAARYITYLLIIFSKVFSDKYYILFIFELLLFLVLTFDYLKKYLSVRSFGNERELILSNILPSFSSSIGVKSFLIFSTFFLLEKHTADIKFIIAFFGLVNFIPQAVTSDYINRIISNQNFSLSPKRIKMYFFALFFISLIFSVILYLIDLYYFDLTTFNFFNFICLGLLNSLIQIYALTSQFFFARGIQNVRLLGDLIFAFILFSLSYYSSKLSVTIFIIFASFASTVSIGFTLLRYRRFMGQKAFFPIKK